MEEATRLDRLFVSRQRGEIAEVTLKQVGGDLDALEKACENRIYSLIAKNALTPELALQAWFEKSSITSLRRRLTNQRQQGRLANKHLEPFMGNGEDDGN